MNRPSATSSAGDWLFSAVKQNPEGLFMLAAAAVLLLRKSAPQVSNAVSAAGARPARAVSEAAAGARSYLGDVADQTRRTASDIAASASDYASSAASAAREQSEQVMRDAGSTLRETVGRVVQEQPFMVAIAGLAAGAAIASVFPSTDIEKETLAPIREQMTEAASQAAEHLKEATTKAGEILKEAAQERGLTTDGMKEVASEVAAAFTGNNGPSGQSRTKPPRPSSAS
jgi:ElaB/YqjD/DUF883 family membrane-anchored ribosome-binding protein